MMVPKPAAARPSARRKLRAGCADRGLAAARWCSG